ncbi:unnamed protein product [Penicillium glandicola]
MHFSKTLATAATFAMTAYAGFPVASVFFLSWEKCDVGHPALGEPKSSAEVSTTPVTCDATPVSHDWSVDNYSFRARVDTKDAGICHGVLVWNNEYCSGDPVHFLPFHNSPLIEGQCLADILDPGFVSFKLACDGFAW